MKDEEKLAGQKRNSILGVLLGVKAANGTIIKSISEHALQRMVLRGYGSSHIKNVCETGIFKSGNKPNTTIIEKSGMRVVLNDENGKMVTVIRL